MTDQAKPDIEAALLDPGSVFASPGEVVSRDDLSKEQKVEILRRWEYDARELDVAEEEEMGNGEPSILDQILNALNALDAGPDASHAAPTKQGGV